LQVAGTFLEKTRAREQVLRALSEGDIVARARIIHFGKDDCHRVSVLRSEGYAVEDCRSLRAFREALEAQPDAVFITEREGSLQKDAVSLSRSCSTAPLVLFRRSNSDLRGESFDLVIDSLSPPTRWLMEIGELLARSGTAEAARPESRSGSRSESRSDSRSGPRSTCDA
jgi:hypothetical protein